MSRQINILPTITNVQYDDIKRSCQISLNIKTNGILFEQRYNIRLVLATKNTCAKDLDFITQHYNEYVALSMDNAAFQKSVTTYRYNKYLKKATDTTAIYLRTSNPFSPFSSDMTAAEAIFDIGGLAHTHSIPPGIALFDNPLQGMVKKPLSLEGQRYSLEYQVRQIDIPLPDRDLLEHLSVYAFVYDVDTARSLRSNTSMNLTLNTRMSYVGKATVLGQKYLFSPTTTTNPYPSSEPQNTLNAPDAEKYNKSSQEVSLDPVFASMKKLLEPHPGSPVVVEEGVLSPLWTSRDTNENAKLLFAFDLVSHLKKNSTYPMLYNNQKFVDILLEKTDSSISPEHLSKVVEITMSRRTCSPDGFAATNNLGSSLRLVSKETSPSFPAKIILNAREEENLSGQGIKYYEALDDINTSSYSKNIVVQDFQYGVSILTYDSSLEVVRNVARLLLTLKNDATRVKESIDIITDYATLDDIMVRSADGLVSAREAMVRLLDNFDPVLELVLGADQVDFTTILLKELNALSADHFQIQAYASKIVNIFSISLSIFYESLKKTNPENPLGLSFDTVKKSIQNGNDKTTKISLSRVDHFFDEKFLSGKNNHYGVQYISHDDLSHPSSGSSQTLMSINFSDFRERRQQEFNKYFQGERGSSPVVPTNTYLDPSYAYMSPEFVITPNRLPIDQLAAVQEGASAVDYDINKYAQLFSDILLLKDQTKNYSGPTGLEPAVNNQSIQNKTYESITKTLLENYSVTFPEREVIEFSPLKIITGDFPDTVVPNLEFAGDCPKDGYSLLPAVIGNDKNLSIDLSGLIVQSNVNIRLQDVAYLDGNSIERQNETVSRPRPNILPYAILGSMELGPKQVMDNDPYENSFRSLTELKEFIGVTKVSLLQTLQQSPLANFPNQIKSMVGLATSNEPAILGDLDTGNVFDVCRPKLMDNFPPTSTDNSIGIYSNQENIPPYPKVDDPMKSYAKFLAFWMNYRQLGVVEYLAGFGGTNNKNMKNPSWIRMSSEVEENLQDNQKVLCRVRPISSEDYANMIRGSVPDNQVEDYVNLLRTKEMFELPTYDKYFYLQKLEQQSTVLSGDAQIPVLQTVQGNGLQLEDNTFSIGGNRDGY